MNILFKNRIIYTNNLLKIMNFNVNSLSDKLSSCYIQPNLNYFSMYNDLKTKNSELNDKIKNLKLEIDEKNILLEEKNFIIQEKINLIKEKDKYIIASKTARNGFKEEDLVIRDLNNTIDLKYNISKFCNTTINTFVKKIGTSKTDITDNKINIQVKKFKINQFGQIDRHYLSYFFEKIPELNSIKYMLKGLCDLPLLDNGLCDKSKDVIKLNNVNYQQDELDKLINELNKNKSKIIDYAFLGYDIKNKPNILLGIEYDKEKNRKRLICYKMEDVIKYLNTQTFKIRKSGTVIQLGDSFTLQRKGGDGSKKTANHLQFKLIFSKLKIDDKLVYNF